MVLTFLIFFYSNTPVTQYFIPRGLFLSSSNPEQVIDILKTMLMVQFKTPYSNKIYKELILNQVEQKELARQFDLHL